MATNPVKQDDPAYVGNELFVKRKYDEALVAYSKSIEKYPDVAKLYSNRALTYLKLHRPYDALNDIELGLNIEPDNEKLIYRKCTALLEMRRFHDAAQFLDDSLKRLGRIPEKHEKEFKKLIDDMDRLKVEFVEGRYDLLAMIEEAKTSMILAKHADFYAWNKFEIREIQGKGRGLVAKERIELGELLIACEAFVFVPVTEDLDIILNAVRKKLSNRPDLAKQFYRLYAGPQLGHLENGLEGERESVDLMRIGYIIAYNCFKVNRVLVAGSMNAKPQHSGISLIPSYINHTCVDYNIGRYSVGNFTFIRATRAIEKGDELVLPYLVHGLSFEQRQKCFEGGGFECQCRLCQIERQDSMEVKKRLEVIRQFSDGHYERYDATLTCNPDDIQQLGSFIEELRGYRRGLSLDHFAIRVRQALASSVQLLVHPKASFPMWKELIEDLKSGGDFFEALYLAKWLKCGAHFYGGGDEYEALPREIAKMFFDDERVADLME